MLDTLKTLVPEDTDMPPRARELQFRELFRTGEIYDVKAANGQSALFEFHVEQNEAGEYIPLAKRKPSVRYGLAQIIVSDTTALLFGEGHFPAIEVTVGKAKAGKADKTAKQAGELIDDILADLIKETKLQAVMLDGAVKGSVGSVVYWLRVLKGRVFISTMGTHNLTPEWDPEEPDKLLKVVEKYKVKGAVLMALGYTIHKDDTHADFWFQRTWDRAREIWYLPWPVKMEKNVWVARGYPAPETEDPKRTPKAHNLGLVPMVWVRNLPGGNDIDGECTFRAAMSNAVEIDYQISQGGRGLKYSSDPVLHIRDPGYESIGGAVAIAAGPPRVGPAPPGAAPVVPRGIRKGADRALVTGPNSEAKLLEINGTAAKAVEDYVRFMREISLELCGGNRTSPERLTGAQSGRAMEMMNQSLIWVADKLRSSYGEGALVDLLKMVLAANQVYDLMIAGETHPKGTLPKPEKARISLKWPPWYPPTAADDANEAIAIKTHREAGILSRETGVRKIAPRYDIEDPIEEMDRIDADLQADTEREIETQTAIKPPASPRIAKEAA